MVIIVNFRKTKLMIHKINQELSQKLERHCQNKFLKSFHKPQTIRKLRREPMKPQNL